MNTVTMTAGKIRPGTVIEYEGRQVVVLSATPHRGQLPYGYSDYRCDYAGCDGRLGLGTIVAFRFKDEPRGDALMFHKSHTFTVKPAPPH